MWVFSAKLIKKVTTSILFDPNLEKWLGGIQKSDWDQ